MAINTLDSISCLKLDRTDDYILYNIAKVQSSKCINLIYCIKHKQYLHLCPLWIPKPFDCDKFWYRDRLDFGEEDRLFCREKR